MEIVVAHQRLDAAQEGPVPVFEGLGDDSLEAQGQHVV